MISPFGVEHGYEIAKANTRSSYEQRRKGNTAAGSVVGGYLGLGVGAPMAAAAADHHDNARHHRARAKDYKEMGSKAAWAGRRNFDEGHTQAKYAETHVDRMQGERKISRAADFWERSGGLAESAAKSTKTAEAALKSRNKWGVAAAGTVVAGTAAGGALGHYGTHKPKRTSGA